MAKELYVILHNIRSAYNVGSIFRTADGAGVQKIYLTGYTPAPIDRFGNVNKEIAKTALGAEKFVPWEKHKDVGKLIAKFKKEKIKTIAVEQAPKSINYRNLKIKNSAVFIFGNEVRGLSKQILKKCDATIEIPMTGRKESLNVSVAAGIILFRI